MRRQLKLLSCVVVLIVGVLELKAQDKVVGDMKAGAGKSGYDDTSYHYNAKGWRKGGIVSLSLAQGNSSNWAAGAEKSSFSVAGLATLFANKKKGDFFWNNSLDLSYAMQRTSSQGTRKTDDKIDFYSKVGKDISPTWAIAGVVNLRTQFSDGFDYDYLGKGLKRRTSGIFAPAYLLISPGIEWKPKPYFNVLFSPISARWVLVTNDPYSYYYEGGVDPDNLEPEKPLAALYGVNAARKVAFQAGAYLSASFNKEILKNVVYKSRLDLFSNYMKTHDPITDEKIAAKPKNVDVFWTNTIVMKINKWLGVTYNFDLIYDDDVKQFGPNMDSPGTQVRSLLGVGLATKL
ncbi:DUF3078 domain-containing protein [Flavihumibacter petaseus]|uniref:DUF3078 domain-containing protein n=1 Tax=Flavihumibacter petaseus NBRC 106054 TaxID=1220578 RepID=A0A0E9MVW4_9BACT|nr:DUF3078 domain-containing protein [Flavihumibacter petaseus]GAO41734.1 hypothetical protein FPE01S_01_07480 [Flavihumibacter petaseus NBRC 106054]